MLLGMAVASVVIAVCLVLGGVLPFQDASTAPVFAASEGAEVTHGSVIKLMHDKTKFRLHSHEVPYGSGSGQQSVTGFPGVEDSNSYWIVHLVKPEGKPNASQGDVIPNGSTVRLQHSRTRKWLHSHLHQSPISANLEVSCFGGDGQSDTGDHWRIEVEGKGDAWLRDQKVRLLHIDTGGYLHSHDKKYSRIVAGQQEVCGVTKKGTQNLWVAAEGVYFPLASFAQS
eukprot:TRINITY_DN9273_c0_g1_i1.p1 TRINITY_DN9273_c0_g1~~TRINITY_DN9273_c0_g1_i1.p1  ORF type:complete len:227 (-),score=32.70 TRINITY_DN9273_c0_g1_i1:261-941(-)